MLPHSRVELRRWFDSHKVGDCVWLSGAPSSEPTRDPLEALRYNCHLAFEPKIPKEQKTPKIQHQSDKGAPNQKQRPDPNGDFELNLIMVVLFSLLGS